MSEVEETIERIKVQGGVEGYVICNKQGQVLRRFPSMSLEDAEKYANSMISLTSQARGVIRDLDPKNELRYLRIRAKKHEIMVAYVPGHRNPEMVGFDGARRRIEED